MHWWVQWEHGLSLVLFRSWQFVRWSRHLLLVYSTVRPRYFQHFVLMVTNCMLVYLGGFLQPIFFQWVLNLVVSSEWLLRSLNTIEWIDFSYGYGSSLRIYKAQAPFSNLPLFRYRIRWIICLLLAEDDIYRIINQHSNDGIIQLKCDLAIRYW